MDVREASSEQAGIAVVALPAEIDLGNAGQVHDMLTRPLAGDVTALIADMTGTAYCSLEGLQALLRARSAATAAGKELQLAAVRPAVRRLLELTGTSALFRCHPSLETVPAGPGGTGRERPGPGSAAH